MLSAVNSCWRGKSRQPSSCNWRRPSSVFGRRFHTGFDGDAAEDRESGATSAGDIAGASEDSERSQCFEICMCEKTMEKRWP